MAKVDTRSEVHTYLPPSGVDSKVEVGPTVNGELFDSTQELPGGEILDDVAEEEPDGYPGDMAEDHAAFNFL